MFCLKSNPWDIKKEKTVSFIPGIEMTSNLQYLDQELNLNNNNQIRNRNYFEYLIAK